MSDRFVAAAPGTLFEQLVQRFPTWSRNTLRQRLRSGCIEVNGRAVSRHDQPLQPGDAVEVLGRAAARAVRRGGPELAVLFVDDDLLAIDKPAGLLSVSTDDEHERTALAQAKRQVGGDLWPAHRIDRETSGVLLFARSRAVCDRLRAGWEQVHKVYRAIVEGRPEPARGSIELPLWEDRNLRVRTGPHAEARAARTRYATIESRGGRSLLEVELDTGRKHQIRVHLQAIGCPVVGDERYGTRGARLCLHAVRLDLLHPRDGRPLRFEAEPPADFRREFGP